MRNLQNLVVHQEGTDEAKLDRNMLAQRRLIMTMKGIGIAQSLGTAAAAAVDTDESIAHAMNWLV